ncbi:hypothetical protein AKJ16_DCAP21524 [Drosera capensis]
MKYEAIDNQPLSPATPRRPANSLSTSSARFHSTLQAGGAFGRSVQESDDFVVISKTLIVGEGHIFPLRRCVLKTLTLKITKSREIDIAALDSTMAIKIDQLSTSNRIISNSKHTDVINLDDDKDDFRAEVFESVPIRGTTKRNRIDVDDYENIDYGDDLDLKRAIYLSLLSTPDHKRRRRELFGGKSVHEPGESSWPVRSRRLDKLNIACEMCVQRKFEFEYMKIVGCLHRLCYGCARKYIVSSLRMGTFRITCPLPDCEGLLELENCCHVLAQYICIDWSDMLCKSVVRSLTDEDNDHDEDEDDPGDVKEKKMVSRWS